MNYVDISTPMGTEGPNVEGTSVPRSSFKLLKSFLGQLCTNVSIEYGNLTLDY